MSSLQKIGVAVMGLGRMGTTHVKNLQASGRASVKWLVVNNVPKAEAMAQRFESQPICIHHSQMHKMLMDDSVNAVFICTPTTHHEKHIEAALNQGKAVFCEKPLTATIEDTKECYQLAESKHRPLFCAFHRRFDPSFSKVREHIRSYRSGRLRLLRFSSHDPSLPPIQYIKTSGGILKDSTIHDLDLALWMSGSPAKSVYVQGQAFNPEVQACGDHDLVVVIVTHQNGAVSVIDNGRRCAHGYDQRLEAQCEDGSFIVSNRPSHLVTQHGTDHRSGTGISIPPIDQLFDTRYPDAYALEMEHFLDVVQGKATQRVSKEDTIAAMTLADAAMESIRTGTKVTLA